MTDITTTLEQLQAEAQTTYRETEKSLLGAVLRDGRVYEQAREVVQADMFFVHAFGWVWEAFESLYSRRMGIDTFTVADELERAGKLSEFRSGMWSGRALLSDIRDYGEPRNVMTYAEKVQDQSIKRKLSPMFSQWAYNAQNGRTAKDILADIEAEMSQITIYNAQDEYTVPISAGVSEAYDWTDKASRGEIVGVPTGFVDLDNLLVSLIAGNVYLIAARPGQGKTALCLTIANHVATLGKRVGIFSLEMSRMQVSQRLISQVSGIDLNAIMHGKMQEKDWALYTHAIEQVSAMPIVINDLSSINVSQIRQTARKIKAAGGLDLIIVDYLQLTSGEARKYERSDLEIGAVSRGLKTLARELNVPVLAAAQLSRAVEQRTSKKPILSDLRESGNLEQDAYAVMFLYHDEDSSDKQNIFEVIVAKHRNGPVGSCELVYRAPITKFENSTTRIFRPNE